MNIIRKLENANYVATDKDIEQLARTAADGSRAGGTYLRCLVAAIQSELQPTVGRKRGRPRKETSSIETSVEACERSHSRLYELVKRGIADAVTDAAEINRRATFARTAASTLRSWIAAGGNVGTLDLATLTKRQLAPVRDPDAAWNSRVEHFAAEAARMGADAIAAAITALEAFRSNTRSAARVAEGNHASAH